MWWLEYRVAKRVSKDLGPISKEIEQISRDVSEISAGDLEEQGESQQSSREGNSRADLRPNEVSSSSSASGAYSRSFIRRRRSCNDIRNTEINNNAGGFLRELVVIAANRHSVEHGIQFLPMSPWVDDGDSDGIADATF